MQMPGEELKPDRESALFTSEQRYRTLVETMGDGLSEIDEHQVTTYANETLCRMWGRSGDEIIGQKVDQFLDDENRKILLDQLEKRRKGGTDPYEIVWIKKDGSRLHSIMTPTPYFDADGRFKGSFAVVTDISTQKKEKNLLELRVRQRTKEIEDKTQSLEEVNTALRVLLKKREEDKDEIGEKIFAHHKLILAPIIQNLKKSLTLESQKNMMDILESELKNIISPFSKQLSDKMVNLTPREIYVADLIKFGKSNKEISEILNSSIHTISRHRENIRKKTGLKNKKINFRSFLSTLE